MSLEIRISLRKDLDTFEVFAFVCFISYLLKDAVRLLVLVEFLDLEALDRRLTLEPASF